jgi:hypothetical protein
MAQKKKKRDLKARLGKTISPGGAKGGGVVPPPSGGGVVPPPSVGGSAPGGGGVVPPPSIGGAPAGGGAVPAPPFGKKEEKKKSSDPFGPKTAAAEGPREVRLVIDDKTAVDDKEVGRKKRGRNFILLGVGLIVGLVVGYGGGNMMSDRQLYNLAVRDGKDIYESVRNASDVVTKAQRYIDTATGTARGGAGKAPDVDVEALEALRALEKPLDANAFARKRYGAFQPQTVDALFEYYNNVNLLWDHFERITNRTLPEARLAAIRDAAAATQGMTNPTGCVPSVVEEQFVCGLVFVRANEETGGMMVRASLTTTHEFEKVRFMNTEDQQSAFFENPDNFVIINHPERSQGVLGEQASLFATYAASLSEAKGLLDRTVELQGRLETDLGQIARLEEVMAF